MQSQAPGRFRKSRVVDTSQPVPLRPRKVNNTNTGFLARKYKAAMFRKTEFDPVKVPNETIAAIFTEAIKPVSTQEDIYENELLRDTLIQICMKFEAVVNGLPVLWTFIMLETEDEINKRPCKLDASVISVHNHIAKSLGRPLHVAFNLAVLPARVDDAFRSWNALLATSGRWSSLFVRGAGTCAKESICVEALLGGDVLGRATRLGIVDIAKRLDIPCPKTHKPVRMCSSKVMLFRSTLPTDIAVSPSSTLRYLSIVSDQRDLNWSHFFSSCPNLSQLRWHGKVDFPSSPSITMPSLQRLTLWTLRHLPPVLAPNLTRLEVLDSLVPMDTPVIVKFAGSPNRLTTLILPTNPVTNSGLLAILEECPHIQRLIASGVEPRTRVYDALSRKVLFQLRMNEKHRMTGIAFQRDRSAQLYEDEEAAGAQLKELCRPPEPNERPRSDCVCFLPISRGTCVVVSGFPYPLNVTDVAHVYSRAQTGFDVPVLKVWVAESIIFGKVPQGEIGFDVPVLKVWVAESIIFGKVPQGEMTLVILLDLKWGEADFLATLGFDYGGKKYQVVCNKDSRRKI
ncbi:hypothetical protein R3P38DRAFT_3214431 [Favolaschia claudopus]|uniref:Uncharacterized protein n=1 Tax=Favolaschia claudopus TaxID=2862362 RepID=A0AAW0AC16_9AGAR